MHMVYFQDRGRHQLKRRAPRIAEHKGAGQHTWLRQRRAAGRDNSLRYCFNIRSRQIVRYNNNLQRNIAMTKDRFYFHVSLVMTVIVFVGFGPSFYWKPVVASAGLNTVWVGLHALACSLWMLLLCMQTSFVLKGRTDLHRRLGVTGVVLIPIIWALGFYIALDFIRRNYDLVVVERDEAHRFFLSGSVVGIWFFVALASAALLLRKNAGAHKRLMVLATLVLISASFARLPVTGPAGPPWSGIPLWTLLGWIAFHDFKTEGKLHKANRIGIPLVLLYAVLVIVMSVSPGLDFIASLVVD